MTVVDERIERLSAASLRKVIEPDTDVPGSVGAGMVLPRELLSVRDLDLALTDDQWETLAREELASILDAGLRLESILMAGFGLMIAYQRDLRDPRVTYTLHEVGEETRHSRLFARVITQLEPTADNPFTRGILCALDRLVTPKALQRQALFCIMVLTGEEGPDLLQKRSSEHPGTDPFIREVNRYHRLEEARHLAFARTLLPEVWREAPALERLAVRQLGPAIMTGIFDSLVHPGVYRTVGLPGWRTWNAVRKSQSHRQLRAEALRPVLDAARDAGVFGHRGRLPRPWRQACLVDSRGTPTP
jgi:predicted metal-dependent hydrolase